MARKARSFYSNSEYQSKMLKIFFGISAVQGSCFALIGFGLLENIKSVAEKSGIQENHPFFESLRIEEAFVYVVVLASIAITTLVFTWIGLKFSHEAVGAIYRMKKDIEIMTANKEITLLKLRRNDYFKEFENSFNDMVLCVKPLLESTKNEPAQVEDPADNVEPLHKKQA